MRLHKVSLTKISRAIKCWDSQFLLALAFTAQNAGGTVIPNRCSLLIKRNYINKAFFGLQFFRKRKIASFQVFVAM